jgi:hypothetical protein
MKTRLIVSLVGVAAILIGASIAAAGGRSASTTLTLVDFADSNNNGMSDYIIGTVSSPKRKCEGGRTVKIIRRFPGAGELKLIDTARTSTKGYWAGGGVEEINSIEGRVSVTRRVIRSGGRRLTCKPVGENFD